MPRGCLSFACAGILTILVCSSVYGQGSTGSSLSGVVLDAAGAVVPGATIVVKNNATNTLTETISNSSGAFSLPALDAGIYTVTVSLSGFKTAIISEVRLQAAIPADLKVTLEVGGVEETVTVRGDTELVQTRSAAVSSSTGYGALGAPEGKYLAPANGPDCIQTVEGDCAPRHQYVFSPWFTRFDMSLVKKFALVGRSNFELRLDVMNVFNNVNLTPVAQTGTSATVNQVTAAYQDNSNTFDPGGRLGQLGFRFNW